VEFVRFEQNLNALLLHLIVRTDNAFRISRTLLLQNKASVIESIFFYKIAEHRFSTYTVFLAF